MNISDLHDIIPATREEHMAEALEAMNSNPIDSGSLKATAETARKLILAEIPINVHMHGENPSHQGLKNKIYITVPSRLFDQAKKISDNVKDLIDN